MAWPMATAPALSGHVLFPHRLGVPLCLFESLSHRTSSNFSLQSLIGALYCGRSSSIDRYSSSDLCMALPNGKGDTDTLRLPFLDIVEPVLLSVEQFKVGKYLVVAMLPIRDPD